VVSSPEDKAIEKSPTHFGTFWTAWNSGPTEQYLKFTTTNVRDQTACDTRCALTLVAVRDDVEARHEKNSSRGWNRSLQGMGLQVAREIQF
jgi:hypothetical protein